MVLVLVNPPCRGSGIHVRTHTRAQRNWWGATEESVVVVVVASDSEGDPDIDIAYNASW